MPAGVRFYSFVLAGEQRHQLSPSIPRSPGIIPVVAAAGFSCRRSATVLSRNNANLRLPRFSAPRILRKKPHSLARLKGK